MLEIDMNRSKLGGKNQNLNDFQVAYSDSLEKKKSIILSKRVVLTINYVNRFSKSKSISDSTDCSCEKNKNKF